MHVPGCGWQELPPSKSDNQFQRMSYQVLARKWRPGTFREMVGQAHVLKTLTNALEKQRLHHAYLFTGTRGVGKTTVARILAKCLNCEKGISAEPCGVCSACIEISEGRFLDLIEVDAASRTKVEDTRELLENVQYAPARGRFKIYLIDEVHMLSAHSFNALLKTLEEPPPHVKFLLATTDPQKLPVTILSRCLQFNLKNLSPQFIAGHLSQVLGSEGISAEEQAVWQLANAASGSMRDALTLLDQAISFCDGKITNTGVTDMLGVPGSQMIYGLLDALRNREARQLLRVCAEAAEHGPDYGMLIESLMGVLHRIAVVKAVPEFADNSRGDLEQVREFAASLAAEDIQLYFQMCIKAKSELVYAGDAAAMFEMLMVRMLVFTPGGKPRIPVASTSAETTGKKSDAGPVTDPAAGQARQAATGAAVNATPAISQSGPADTDLAGLNATSWLDLFPRLQVSGITGSILGNCVCNGLREGRLSFTLPDEHSAVYSEEHRLRIQEMLSAYFGQKLDINIEIGTTSKDSPAAREARIRQQNREKLVAEFASDPGVTQLVDRFSGTLLTDSITSTN